MGTPLTLTLAMTFTRVCGAKNIYMLRSERWTDERLAGSR
jgi:hypothetical protein